MRPVPDKWLRHMPEPGVPEQPAGFIFLTPGGGEESPDPIGYPQQIKASQAATRDAYILHEMMKPPGEGPRVHTHPDMEEAFYILEGEFTFALGDDEVQAPAGSFLLVPRGTPHGFRNSGETDGRYLRLFSPAPNEGLRKVWEDSGSRIAEGRSRNEGTTHELFARETSRLQN